jgi:heme-degrading monooxygenase HmoA
MNSLKIAATVATLSCALTSQGPALAQPAPAQTPDRDAPVVTIVRVPAPWYAPRFLVVRRMRESVPQYQSIDGLVHKAYSLARPDGRYGGIYLWKDRASAQAWFSPAWFERVEKERGAPGEVRAYEVVFRVDGEVAGAPTGSDLAAVATLIEFGPRTGPESAAAGQASLAAANWRGVAGLLRSYVVRSPEGGPGAVVLWRDEASARAWLDGGWGERVAREYGAPPRIAWFDIPIMIVGQEGRVAAAGEARR